MRCCGWGSIFQCAAERPELATVSEPRSRFKVGSINMSVNRANRFRLYCYLVFIISVPIALLRTTHENSYKTQSQSQMSHIQRRRGRRRRRSSNVCSRKRKWKRNAVNWIHSSQAHKHTHTHRGTERHRSRQKQLENVPVFFFSFFFIIISRRSGAVGTLFTPKAVSAQ